VLSKKWVAQKKTNYSATDHPMCKNLPSDHFSIIYADPPFEYSRKVGSGVANNHYMTMTDKELFQMEVPRVCTKDSALFLWCSGPTMTRALELMKAWGFTYKTVGFVWVKTSKVTVDKLGLGKYTRPGTKFVLIRVKGKFASRLNPKLRPDQVMLGPRGAHSAKPMAFRDKIASMIPDDDCICLELFSRIDANEGWSVWGDQAGLLTEEGN
jgi:N6-adenosine-specific RNA methylase IME4